jgi:SAM-dependent methyltransferase
MDKYDIQDSQYEFPYHHIPDFDEMGHGKRYRLLSWGLSYLCYQKHIMNLVESMHPSSLLEAGCGDGFFIGHMKSIRNRTGADTSETALRYARAFHPDVNFYQGDIANIDDSYDVVVAIEVLEHIPDDSVSDFITSLANRTKSSGRLIICVPTKVLPLVRKHYRHYDIELLRSQIMNANAPLEVENVEYIYRNSILFKIYNILTVNKLWFFDPTFLKGVIWRYVWNKLRIADVNKGEHMIVVLKKTSR